MKESFDRHCDDDDRRHVENITEMRGIKEEIAGLRLALEPLAASVAIMRPIVDGYQLTRSKLAAWASIGLAMIVLLGWIVEAALKWVVAWTLSHFQ